MATLGIESVLVAGRGPAACAVIEACTRLEVKAVAVHSETEGSARHVRLADDAVLLGPAPAAESHVSPAPRGEMPGGAERRPDQLLGRLPWLALLFLRALRLRAFFAIRFSPRTGSSRFAWREVRAVHPRMPAAVGTTAGQPPS